MTESESPKKFVPTTVFERVVQPVDWLRAFVCGVFASWVMMAFIDIFYMLGFTEFSLEAYVGSTLRGSMEYMPRAWIVGCIANWIVGGFAGIIYGYLFEYLFKKANARNGVYAGLMHVGFAAIAIFPFFNAIRGQMGLSFSNGESFGILGSGLGIVTPIILIMAHLFFGATIGTAYGPVRSRRVRAKIYEPGEWVKAGHKDAIREDEDHDDRPFYGYGS